MKIYKVKAPSGKMSKQSYSRGLAFQVRNYWNDKFKTKDFKVIVWVEDAIVHDHPLTQYDSKKYVITHFELNS